MAAKKIRNAKDDERKGRARFVDQRGQWKNTTPASTKKKQAKEWDKLATSMKKGKKK